VEVLAGLRGNYLDGVFFTEEPGEEYRTSQVPLQVKIARQNANLPELKRQLARKVRESGGNALVGFSYGQKKSLFGWDHVAWQGAGYPARIDS